MRMILVAGLVALLAAPALAANLEYGQEYEAAFLDQCTQEHSERACQCAMELMESRVGFTAFADQVDEYRQSFMERSDLRLLAAELVGRCTAIGRAQ